MARKITYNLAIFSVAELAKPQARREPVARFVVLPSDVDWLDVHAHLKIKAGDVLFPGQAAIHDTNLCSDKKRTLQTFVIKKRTLQTFVIEKCRHYK